MDSRKVDLVLQYALAVAGERDPLSDDLGTAWKEREAAVGRARELGEIHLLKYVYLADLAYAAAHAGESFTGAPWRFHHYGPYTAEVWKRIEPALQAIGACKREFQSRYRDDVRRWSIRRPHLAEELEPQLPFEVARAVRRAVQDYGNDTPALLHAVYSTAPMLEAAPGENLSLTAAAPEPAPEGVAPSVKPLRPLSKTHLKKLRQRVEERLEEIRRRESERAARRPRPIYDEVFFAGRDWLEGLAGAPIEEEEGEVCIDDEVWHSLARREPKLP